MAICVNYLKIAFAITGHKTALFTRLRCKRWSCEYCCQKNARAWQYWLIKRLPEVSQDWWFVTLTANENTRDTIGSLENLRRGIDALIKRARRVFGKDIEYARVYEIHPTSLAVHAHFIMSGLTPFVARGVNSKAREIQIGVLNRVKHHCIAVKTWFKTNARDLKMGYMADVQKFVGDTSIVAFYVTKYLTKEQGLLNVRNLRHVQVTRGIGTPQFENTYVWETASYITPYNFEPNTAVTDLDTGRVIDNNYWEHTGFYPNDDLTT